MACVTITNMDHDYLDHHDKDEGFGDGENDTFFSSLYDTLEGSPSSCPHLRPNLRFEFYGGEEWVEAHLVVMAHWCLKLPHVLLKGEDGGLICGVPASLGVTPESFRIFRKAIYLKKLPSRSLTFEDRMQVRRLAEHFGCRMVLEKCDDVKISLKNCHILWNKWPEGSQVNDNALNLVKRNLKTLVEMETYLDWTEEFWITVLSLNDLSPPGPSEDDLFSAAFKWHKGKNKSDSAKFRSLFRDLFRYHLMPRKFLLSETFKASGALDDAELLDVFAQKEGLDGVTNFTKTPRTLIVAPSPIESTSSSTTVVVSSANSTKRKRGPIPNQNVTAKRLQKKLRKDPLEAKKKDPKGVGTSTQISANINTPTPAPSTSDVISLPPTASQPKKSVASNFVELQKILQTVTAGEEIQLMAGTFDGLLDIENLPEGVKIVGAGGGQTIITAAPALSGPDKYIWNFGNLKRCTFQNLRFEKKNFGRRTKHKQKGFEINGEGVMIHNVSFLGCHLTLCGCVGADVFGVMVKSSDIGICLDGETTNALVRNCSLNGVETGIEVGGSRNKISNVECVDVQTGVDIRGTSFHLVCFENTLSGLTYTFSNKKVDLYKIYEQIAVKIHYSKNNVVENVKCLGYATVRYAVKPHFQHLGAYALWIKINGEWKASSSGQNKVKTVSGGPISVDGKGNVIEDVTNCPFLQSRGSDHTFTNCVVVKADTKQTKNANYTNCNFNANSCDGAEWMKNIAIDGGNV